MTATAWSAIAAGGSAAIAIIASVIALVQARTASRAAAAADRQVEIANEQLALTRGSQERDQHFETLRLAQNLNNASANLTLVCQMMCEETDTLDYASKEATDEYRRQATEFFKLNLEYAPFFFRYKELSTAADELQSAYSNFEKVSKLFRTRSVAGRPADSKTRSEIEASAKRTSDADMRFNNALHTWHGAFEGRTVQPSEVKK